MAGKPYLETYMLERGVTSCIGSGWAEGWQRDTALRGGSRAWQTLFPCLRI